MKENIHMLELAKKMSFVFCNDKNIEEYEIEINFNSSKCIE